MNNFLEHYNSVKERIVKDIKQFNNYIFNNDDNGIVKFAKEEFKRINFDGKLIRGFLIYLGFNTFNKKQSEDYVLPLCAAYEAFESAILIHDDIIDNATLRRGKLTIPNSYIKKYADKQLGDSMAICISDLAYFNINKYLLEKYKDNPNLFKVLKLYNEIVIKTIEGQFIDVELPVKNKQIKSDNIENDVFDIYLNKTAWYTIIGPFKLGIALSGNDTSLYDSFLEKIGISFQIKDDLLGIYGDNKITGKSTSSDISEFKQTILYAYVNDQKKEYLDELLKYYGKNDLKEDDIIKVQNIFKDSGAKDYALSKLDSLLTQAKEDINNSNLPFDTKNMLLGLTEFIKTREK